MNVAGAPHRIAALELRGLSIEAGVARGDVQPMKIEAQLAFVRDDTRTCGEIRIQGVLMSEETKSLLAQAIASIERDAASAIFSVPSYQPERAEPL